MKIEISTIIVVHANNPALLMPFQKRAPHTKSTERFFDNLIRKNYMATGNAISTKIVNMPRIVSCRCNFGEDLCSSVIAMSKISAN